MRILNAAALAVALALAAGCARTSTYDGPTVDKFNGKVVQGGKLVEFAGESVELKMFHEKGRSFGVPVQPDGTFNVGWMPTGKYSVTLMRNRNEGGKKGAPNMYSVPGGLTVVDGQTDYEVDLGKGWKR